MFFIKIQNKFNYSTEFGFTLLLASLVASLLLSIGLSIFTVAQKEVILSSMGRDSQYAFYAADAGAECALYWDYKGGFATSTPTHGAKCNEQSIGTPYGGNPDDLVIGGNPYIGGVSTSEFWFEQNNKCINVTVSKYESGQYNTQVDSRGYSVPCDSSGEPIHSSRTLERAVRMLY